MKRARRHGLDLSSGNSRRRPIRPRFKLAGESHLTLGVRGPSTRAEAGQDILVFLGHIERVF